MSKEFTPQNAARVIGIGENVLKKIPSYKGHNIRITIGSDPLEGNAINFKNGISLKVDGLSGDKINLATVLAIGIEAHLIREQVAKKLARRFECSNDLRKILEVL